MKRNRERCVGGVVSVSVTLYTVRYDSSVLLAIQTVSESTSQVC